MLEKLPLLSLACLIFILYSCHKNNDAAGDSGQLTGNYKFLYISLQAQSTTYESGGAETKRTVVYTNYKTVDNSGAITFTRDSIFSKGVKYSADGVSNTYTYKNDKLTDSLSVTYTQTSNATFDSATKFNVIGKDSIAYRTGFLPVGLIVGPAITPASGGQFSFKGDTLFITSKYFQNPPSQTSGGVTMSQSVSGMAVIGMLRQ